MRLMVILLVATFWLSGPVQAEVDEVYDFDTRSEENAISR